MNNPDNESEEKDALTSVINWSSDILSGLSGAIIELTITGSPGAIIAGIGAPVISILLQSSAKDIINRHLSHRQKARIGTALYFAAQTIKWNLNEGRAIRKDNFFQDQPDDRSTAEEIVEAVIFAAQQETAEKKLQLYGRLLANIAFREDIDRGIACQLISYGQQLSYRQLCLMSLFKTHRRELLEKVRGVRRLQEEPLAQESVKFDFYDLLQKGLLRNSQHPLNQLDLQETHYVYPSPLGLLISDLMGLEEIMQQDKEKLLATLPRHI